MGIVEKPRFELSIPEKCNWCLLAIFVLVCIWIGAGCHVRPGLSAPDRVLVEDCSRCQYSKQGTIKTRHKCGAYDVIMVEGFILYHVAPKRIRKIK